MVSLFIFTRLLCFKTLSADAGIVTRSTSRRGASTSQRRDPQSSPSSRLLPSPTPVHALQGRELVAYRWSAPNSCFWDCPLELLYRCYRTLPPSSRSLL